MQHEGRGLGEGFFCPKLSYVQWPSGVRVLSQRWDGPNSTQSPESSATFHGEKGLSKTCCSAGCFLSPDLFGFAGKDKTGAAETDERGCRVLLGKRGKKKERDWRKRACIARQDKS